MKKAAKLSPQEQARIQREFVEAMRFTGIVQEIRAERDAQDKQWGGTVHDDAHALCDWCLFIGKQLRYAATWFFRDSRDFETRMIKIAALAIAAIESSRRRRGPGFWSGAQQ